VSRTTKTRGDFKEATGKDISALESKVRTLKNNTDKIKDLGQVVEGNSFFPDTKDGLVTFLDGDRTRQVGILVNGELFQLVRYE
jgi:hypothetical protein